MAIKENSVSVRLVSAFRVKDLKEVADKIEEKYTSLHNWTSGRRDFPTEILIRIAKMTNHSIDWILTGEEKILKKEDSSFDSLLEEKIRRIVSEEIDSKNTEQEFYEADLSAKNIKNEKEKKKVTSSSSVN